MSKVYISDVLVIKACNTPGGSGGVAREMNKWTARCMARARMTAPVNNVLNAVHRGGVVGTYAASFKRYRRGNGHYLLRSVYNVAPHAVFVERGRSSTSFAANVWAADVWPGWYHKNPDGSYNYGKRYTVTKAGWGFGNRWERFSWTGAKSPGAVMWYAGTRGRKGHHTLENAWKWSTRKYEVAFIRGRNMPNLARIPAWAGPGTRPIT